MEPEERRRLSEAVEQARKKAADAASNLEADETSAKRVENAIREAEVELRRLREAIEADD